MHMRHFMSLFIYQIDRQSIPWLILPLSGGAQVVSFQKKQLSLSVYKESVHKVDGKLFFFFFNKF